MTQSLRRGLLLVALAACEQPKAGPAPAVAPGPRLAPQDAAVDAASVDAASVDAAAAYAEPPVLADYQLGAAVDQIPASAKPPARTGDDLLIVPTAVGPDEGRTWTLTIDSPIAALHAITGGRVSSENGHAWLVTMAAVQLASDRTPPTRTQPTDEASRSFILSLPANAAIDLHTGQHLRGQIEWMNDGGWGYSMQAWLEDDQGVVLAYDPRGPNDHDAPSYDQGARTRVFPAEAFEDIYAIAVTLDHKKLQVAGWTPSKVAGAPYLLYGYANRQKPNAMGNDYVSHTTFAMVRSPKPGPT